MKNGSVKNIIILLLLLLSIYFYFNIDTNTVERVVEKIRVEVKVVEKTDTIQKVVFNPPKIRYVEKYKDRYVYVDSNKVNSIQVNEYNEIFTRNSSTAKLKILTTGELKNISGTITCKDSITTVYRDAMTFIIQDNMYLGAEVSNRFHTDGIDGVDLSITADYTKNNKWLLGARYSPFTKSFGVRFAFKLF